MVIYCLKDNPSVWTLDSSLGMLIIYPSPNHQTTTQPNAQGKYFKTLFDNAVWATNNIKHCKRSVTKLHVKAKHFKIKA